MISEKSNEALSSSEESETPKISKRSESSETISEEDGGNIANFTLGFNTKNNIIEKSIEL